MNATATVSPIARAGESENKEDNFVVPRIWNRLRNKIKIMINHSINIIEVNIL